MSIPLSRILRRSRPGVLFFWCPGCEQVHQVNDGPGHGPTWEWNGDADRPTFRPSLLVRYEGWDGDTPVREVCHSFITEGQIQFLGDCTHKMAGQTVPIPDWESRGTP